MGVADLPDMPSGAALRLIGGRGTLATPTPMLTVESYWPYATTLFDYIRRAMPFTAPGSLGNDEVYAVTAFILGEAKIIDRSTSLDQSNLAQVNMPNRDGFIPDPRPEFFKEPRSIRATPFVGLIFWMKLNLSEETESSG